MCIFAKVTMDHWNEIRTAYHVVRLGTVSAAAEVLGVHRATVIRHIDALEATLGGKIFQRHANGYTSTEVGKDLLRVAQATDEQFNQLVGRTKGRATELSGELVITSLEVLAQDLLPTINAFQIAYPNVSVRYITSNRLFKLEYGEAHIAVRAGRKPEDPDNVVQPFIHTDVGLYASTEYVNRNGIPKNSKQFSDHGFVGPDNPNSRAPFFVWMKTNIPQDRVVLRTTSQQILDQAVIMGTGIGFIPSKSAQMHGLIEVMKPKQEWRNLSWLVTHVDLHRTAKVQAFLKILKQHI
jgi:DNA-binding transcriptional LysR family regulator